MDVFNECNSIPFFSCLCYSPPSLCLIGKKCIAPKCSQSTNRSTTVTGIIIEDISGVRQRKVICSLALLLIVRLALTHSFYVYFLIFQMSIGASEGCSENSKRYVKVLCKLGLLYSFQISIVNYSESYF